MNIEALSVNDRFSLIWDCQIVKTNFNC